MQKNSRIWLQILPIVLDEELKVLDFILWLKYYFVLLGCFPCSCTFSSLIKFAIWNSGKAYKAKAFLQTRGGSTRGLSPGRAYKVLLLSHHDCPQNCLFNTSFLFNKSSAVDKHNYL